MQNDLKTETKISQDSLKFYLDSEKQNLIQFLDENVEKIEIKKDIEANINTIVIQNIVIFIVGENTQEKIFKCISDANFRLEIKNLYFILKDTNKNSFKVKIPGIVTNTLQLNFVGKNRLDSIFHNNCTNKERNFQVRTENNNTIKNLHFVINSGVKNEKNMPCDLNLRTKPEYGFEVQNLVIKTDIFPFQKISEDFKTRNLEIQWEWQQQQILQEMRTFYFYQEYSSIRVFFGGKLQIYASPNQEENQKLNFQLSQKDFAIFSRLQFEKYHYGYWVLQFFQCFDLLKIRDFDEEQQI